MTLSNLKHCESRFRSHMRARHGIVLSEDPTHPTTQLLRRTLHAVMDDVQRTHARNAALSLRDLHNITLNRTRELMTQDGQLPGGGEDVAPPKGGPPAALPPPSDAGPMLQRGHDVYGHRTPVYNALLPQTTSAPAPPAGSSAATREQEVGELLERARREREGGGAPRLPPAPPATAEQEGALTPDELQRRLAHLRGQREDQEHELEQQPQPQPQQPPPPPAIEGFAMDGPMPTLRDTPDLLAPPRGLEDVQAVARQALALQDAFRAEQGAAAREARDMGPSGAAVLLPPPPETVIVERRIAINGFDRDFTAFPLRNRFDVNVGDAGQGLRDAYRNVAWVEATRIIIPMEVQRPSLADLTSGTALVQKAHYLHDFSMSFPYVMLTLGGLDGAYDGSSEALRRAFTVFVYDRSFKAPNGRGYVMLEPAQSSRRSFPSPLATLGRLKIALQRPNGVLLNNAGDTYSVTDVQYQPQAAHSLMLKCREYFDGNEVFVGDFVMMRGFAIQAPAGASDTSAYATFEAFMNRAEGHEVVALGTPNENGFYNTFYILAPGMLDQGAGRLVLDTKILDAVNALTAATDPAVITSPGRLLNMSMQTVVMLTVGTRMAAPSQGAVLNATAGATTASAEPALDVWSPVS